MKKSIYFINTNICFQYNLAVSITHTDQINRKKIPAYGYIA